jgi:hypothetical protein
VTARPTRSITIRAKDCSTFNFELTEQRVPGDCAFFPRLLEPSERLQRRTDTEDPKVHPRRERLSKCGWKRANQYSAQFGQGQEQLQTLGGFTFFLSSLNALAF